MKTCYEMPEAAIKLEQYANKRFRVTYGKAVSPDLAYHSACEALGGAIMHHLACEGKLDNDGP